MNLFQVIWSTPDEEGTDGQLILAYFLQRLQSPDHLQRQVSADLLPRLLRSVSESGQDTAWLHSGLPQLAFFHRLLPTVRDVLRKSLRVETNSDRLAAYLAFLVAHPAETGEAEPIAAFVTGRPMVFAVVFHGAEGRMELAESLLTALRDGAAAVKIEASADKTEEKSPKVKSEPPSSPAPA